MSIGTPPRAGVPKTAPPSLPPPPPPREASEPRRPRVLALAAVAVAVALVGTVLMMTRGGEEPARVADGGGVAADPDQGADRGATVAEPRSFLASVSASAIHLSWAAPPSDEDVESYSIYRDDQASSRGMLLLVTLGPDTTSYTDTEVAAGHAYAYEIEALCGGTVSERASLTAELVPEVPTPQAPVLVTSSAESVAIRWASAGPGIDRYVVFRDDRRVGKVAPRARRFVDTGLLPDTKYRYRVQAEMDGERSAMSPHLVVHTKPGTLASALLTGSWRVMLVMRSEHNFQSLATGDRYRGVWDFRQRRDGVKVSGRLFGGGHVSALLRGTGPSYEGSTRAQLSRCGATRVTDTIHIRITVTRATTRQQAWRAVALEGTVEDSSPPASSGAWHCGGAGYTATLTARPA